MGVLVCTYGVCADCAPVMEGAPSRLQAVMGDRVEVNLLNKYPELRSKLPDDYGLGVK